MTVGGAEIPVCYNAPSHRRHQKGGPTLQLDPQTFGNFYPVLTGVVVPRPIAFVATVSPEGVANLAPYSFFNVAATHPPTIVFSSSRRAVD